MTTFSQYVAQFPDDDAYDVAKRVVVDEPDMAIPLIAERVQNERRGLVRAIEQGAIRRLLQNKGPRLIADGASRTGTENTRAWLTERIALDSKGTFTTWGQATVDQWQMRKRLLLGQVKGLRDTVKTVDAAIARIQSAGVRCLNDIADELDPMEVAV